MILTGNQIKWAKEQGYLDISSWDEKRLNPNSYNLRLADEIGVYYTHPLEYDSFEESPLEWRKRFKERYIADKAFQEEIDEYVERNDKLPGCPKTIGLDMKKEQNLIIRKIPKDGFILRPGVLYLGRTMEYTKTDKFVPMLEGRSSIGRLGVSVHVTAGFGDIGFEGYWTLEISCVQPVKIYPGVEICQIYYHTIADTNPYYNRHHHGDIYIPPDNWIETYNNGKYQKNHGIQPSMIWKEFV